LYETHCFYKQPKAYSRFLDELLKPPSEHYVHALLVLSTDVEQENTILVLDEVIGNIGEKSIYRHHLCAGWSHNYWKCRADLAACVAITLNRPVSFKGFKTKSNVSSLCEGNEFVGELMEHRRRTVNSGQWHPEDWLFSPDSFLEGVTEGDFGAKNALAGWLSYEEDGVTEVGYARGSARNKFEEALKNLE